MYKNQAGQLVMEAILLIVVLLGVFSVGMNYLQETGYLNKVVSAPLKALAVTIENGVPFHQFPRTGNVEEVARQNLHPNHHTSSGASYRGDIDE